VEREVVRKAYNARVSFDGGYQHYENWKPIETKVAVRFEGAMGNLVATKKKTYPESTNFLFEHLFRDPVNLEDRGNAIVISFISLGTQLAFRNPNKYCVVDLKLNDLENIEKVDVQIVE
jgi:hypothetical protein